MGNALSVGLAAGMLYTIILLYAVTVLRPTLATESGFDLSKSVQMVSTVYCSHGCLSVCVCLSVSVCLQVLFWLVVPMTR